MDNKNANRELVVVPMPDGSLQLEWGVAAGKTATSSVLLQQEIFTTYTSERQKWLLFLGFSDPAVALPASLDFWRKFSGLFVHHLRLTPDLEGLRHLAQVPMVGQELTELLEVIPAMTGGEYVNPRLLAALWLQLNKTFATAISAFPGSVADFIHRFSPGSHLLGRIYFHLVENRDGEEPFAFLATYSTRMGAEGQSKHLPLKYALQEYQDDNDKLLELLVTVYEAARDSELIAALLESNNLFYPLAWGSGDAYTFLQEVPLYEVLYTIFRVKCRVHHRHRCCFDYVC